MVSGRELFILGVFSLVLAACGDNGGTEATGFDIAGDMAAQDVEDMPSQDVGTDALPPDALPPDALPPDSSDGRLDAVASEPLGPGTYASRQRFLALATLPISPVPTESETISLVLHQVRQEGVELRVTHTTCSIRQPEQLGVQPLFSEAFFAAVPVTESTISISGPEQGPWDVAISPDVFVMGATLTDEATEALPTSPDDPRVEDSDGDGNPGVTVTLTGLISGAVYIVQRNTGGLTGVLQADGRMTGRLDGDVEQEVIGATNSALIDFRPEPTKHPDPEESRFVWVPVGPETTCASLVDAETTLFGE